MSMPRPKAPRPTDNLADGVLADQHALHQLHREQRLIRSRNASNLVGADPNLSHRADPILSQGRRPAVWSPAVDKCRSCSGSLTSVVVT